MTRGRRAGEAPGSRGTNADRAPTSFISFTATGIFHATYRLLWDGRFDEGARVWFEDEMEWFDRYLPATRALPDWRAVCWFRGEAGEAISRMWRVVRLVEGEGVPVVVWRTRRPGVVVHEDEIQNRGGAVEGYVCGVS